MVGPDVLSTLRNQSSGRVSTSRKAAVVAHRFALIPVSLAVQCVRRNAITYPRARTAKTYFCAITSSVIPNDGLTIEAEAKYGWPNVRALGSMILTFYEGKDFSHSFCTNAHDTMIAISMPTTITTEDHVSQSRARLTRIRRSMIRSQD
jgi:hypothetical protein